MNRRGFLKLAATIFGAAAFPAEIWALEEKLIPDVVTARSVVSDIFITKLSINDVVVTFDTPIIFLNGMRPVISFKDDIVCVGDGAVTMFCLKLESTSKESIVTNMEWYEKDSGLHHIENIVIN